MSWLSTILPSLATLSTTNPTLVTNIFESMNSNQKAAATVVAHLHSLSMSAMVNPNMEAAVQATITAINSTPGVAKLNISDQVNMLATAKDVPSLMTQISAIENVLNSSLKSNLF